MQAMFGLSTTKDYDLAQKQISSISELLDQAEHDISVHTKVLNVSLIHINEIQTQQKRIIQSITNVESDLTRFVNETELELTKPVNLLSLTSALSQTPD